MAVSCVAGDAPVAVAEALYGALLHDMDAAQ
jgi:hypothetical protein